MSILDSKLWISDLNEIIEVLPELRELAGKTIMITGCTGLICSAVIDVLIRWNETHNEKITILAAGRSKRKIDERFFPYSIEDWFIYIPYDAISPRNTLEIPCDYIIHGASNASPNKIVEEPVETMLSNFFGMKYLLDYGRDKRIKRILYISSSEIYGKKKGKQPYQVGEYGFIDLLNSRNSYSVSKRAAETLCISYADEYSVESVIIRPGHIYGPTAVQSDSRISSTWSYAVARKENIIMKSNGAQIRSYCYCLDSASAILKVLLRGENVHAYNISNPSSIISIREMAEMLAELAGVDVKMEIPSSEERKNFNPMDNSSLDGKELMDLGWTGLFDIKRGLSHTVAILRELL